MKLNKAQSRDRKRYKKMYGMQVSGRSLLVIVRTQTKRASKIRKEIE